MLTAVCSELNNFFSSDVDRITGAFSITGGALTPSIPILEGQHYRIVGSRFNDGVHQSGDVLTDEGEFHGGVWLMRVPRAVLDLVDDITVWSNKYATVDSAAMSPFNSESFGGYSYSKGSGNSSQTATPMTWQTVFADRLKPYRKIRAI